jgi:hypothetical protein
VDAGFGVAADNGGFDISSPLGDADWTDYGGRAAAGEFIAADAGGPAQTFTLEVPAAAEVDFDPTTVQRIDLCIDPK